MIKAIFFDIDGTSYQHSIHDSPESTKLAFRKLKEAGFKLAVCSSRSHPELEHLPSHYWEFMDAMICSAGGQIYVNNQLIINHVLHEEIKDVIQYCDENDLIYRYVTKESQGYLSQSEKEVDDLFYFLYEMIPSVKKYNQEDLVHLLLYPKTRNHVEKIQAMSHHNVVLDMRRITEIVASGVHKGTAILECAKLWGIEQEEIAAFGDSLNDLQMIETAHLGIAMGNAKDDLKQIADYVTDTIENDGLYKACIHFGWI